MAVNSNNNGTSPDPIPVATRALADGKHAQGLVLVASDAAAETALIPATVTDGVLVNLGTNNDVTVTGTVAVTGSATAANQTTLIGHVDGVEALLTTIDADTSVLAAAAKSTAAPTPILLASQTASAQVVAANANRNGVRLTNTDAFDCYLNEGATASATAFTVTIPTGGYWESPLPPYKGAYHAAWAGNGSGSLIGNEVAA